MSGGRSQLAESPWDGRFVLGAGLKLHLSLAQTIDHLRALAGASTELSQVHAFVLPSAPALPAARELLAGSSVAFGAQDVHWSQRGAWTGAVSASDLLELGCTYAEIGHAERRRHFGETDQTVSWKVATAGAAGLVPVVCVGWREQDGGLPAPGEEVAGELRSALLRCTEAFPLLVAYEPAWAIGAERPADAARIRAVIEALRDVLSGWDAPSAVLYGGGVRADAVPELISSGVDGLFVGRAGTQLRTLLEILVAVESSQSVELASLPRTQMKDVGRR